MSSLITHLYISNCIKEEMNLSCKFLTGAVLPDILKLAGEDRDLTHYIKEVNKKGKILKLPDIEKYIFENPDLKENQIELGYLAHLVQDKLWFENFIPQFSTYEGQDIIIYRNGSIHTGKEYSMDIYSDYNLTDRYIINDLDFNINNGIKENIDEFLSDYKLIEILNNSIRLREIKNPTLILMKKEEFELYIELAKQETRKIINKIMNS